MATRSWQALSARTKRKYQSQGYGPAQYRSWWNLSTGERQHFTQQSKELGWDSYRQRMGAVAALRKAGVTRAQALRMTPRQAAIRLLKGDRDQLKARMPAIKAIFRDLDTTDRQVWTNFLSP